MKAYVYEEANKAVLKDVPIPQLGPQEVLVKVRAIGVCHTDLMVLTGVNIVPVPFPFIGGHEWAGEVVETGSEVKFYKPGDRVVGEGNSGCGVCKVCQEGVQDYCALDPVQRGINTDGSMAEYYKLPQNLLHRIPDSMGWKTASLIEPFTVGYNGVMGIGSCNGSDTVVVQGGGPIGLCALIVAKKMGARVILLDPNKYKHDLAKSYGCDYCFNPRAEDVVKAVYDLTDGYGADLVIDASGNAEAMKQSIDLVRNLGRVSYIGVSVGVEVPFEIGRIQMKGLRVQGFLGSPHIWGKAIDFIENTGLDLTPLSTHQFPFENVSDAYEMARTKGKGVIKVTIEMK